VSLVALQGVSEKVFPPKKNVFGIFFTSVKSFSACDYARPNFKGLVSIHPKAGHFLKIKGATLAPLYPIHV